MHVSLTESTVIMVIHQNSSFVQILSHHHFLELIEVHGAATVLVNLLDDVVEVVLCQRVVDLAQDVLQHVVRDEPLALWQKVSWEKVTIFVLFVHRWK